MVHKKRIIIGMLHCPPLPGSPNHHASINDIHHFVMEDAKSLTLGGVDALMLENYGDLPFYPSSVPSWTVAHMTALARKIKRIFPLPLGINVLRNDGLSALAIANACGAQFIRVNIFTGARLTDQGIISGQAHEILRLRKRIGAHHIQIFADIAVKYSTPLTERSIKNEVEETLHRSGTAGLIVSGEGTGKPVDLERLKQVKQLSEGKPVWIGSGTTTENLLSMAPYADGFIVGSAFKPSLEAPIELNRVKQMVTLLRQQGRE